MKISELIEKLERDLESFGDLDVKYLNHRTNKLYDVEYTAPINEKGHYNEKKPVALEIY